MKARTRNERMQALTGVHTHQNCPMYWNIHTAGQVSVNPFNMKLYEHALNADGQNGREEMGDVIGAPQRYECKIAPF